MAALLNNKNNDELQDSTIKTSYDSIAIEKTQKIELNYKEIIGDKSNRNIEIPSGKLNSKKSTGHSIRKILFAKKDVPKEYLEASPVICMISSIPGLEKELELQDIHSNYTLKDQIAEGAQGIVWTAFDKSLRRDAIVKSSKPGFRKKQMQEDINLFVSEARIMAQLDHPAIAPIYGMYSSTESELHLAMKRIEGRTLKNYLQSIVVLYKRDGIETFAEKKFILTRIEYLIRVCEAVDYAHCKGVIHRDLKPENIIIGNHSEVYVMDWGLACLLTPEDASDDEHMTKIGTHPKNELAGTPCYIAPELIRGGACSPQSDVFSLGMILFEIVTLQKAALGESVNEVLRNIVHCNYRPFKHLFLKRGLSKDLKAIITKATCELLSDRYKTANEMAKDLRSYLMRNETVARPDNLFRKYSRAISNHTMLTFSAILSILLCVTVIALYSLYVQHVFVKKQKARESMLVHFQHGINTRSSNLNYTIRCIETQLTNIVNHVEYILSAKAGTTDIQHVYSSVNNVKYAVRDNKSGKLTDKMDKKIVGLDEVIKHMLLTSNLKLKKQTKHFNKQLIKDSGVPIVWIFIAFENGSILSYSGKKNYLKDCNPRKSSWYQEALNKKGIIWSKPFKCTMYSKIVICCLQRISDEENNPIGVIGINIDLAYIERYLVKSEISGMEKYLVNKKGEIILSNNSKYKNTKINPETNTLILKKFSFNKELQRAIKRRLLQFEGTRHNKKYIFGIKHIPSLDYYYVEQIYAKKLQKAHEKHAH